MEITPETQAVCERAMALYDQGLPREALDCMLAIEAHLPDHPVLLANLGMLFRDTGDLNLAEKYLRRACEAQPENAAAHFNLAITLLRAGRLREGFREYEWRWRVPQFSEQRRDFAKPLWRGEPLRGRPILLYGEQGAGDAIQFARYAPLVRNAGAEAILEVLPHLERLISWMHGEYRVTNALAQGERYDLQCPLMTLPARFGTELDSVPPPATFSIPAAVKDRWARRLQAASRNIGLVWAANPAYYNNAARSIPAHWFLPFTKLAGVQCWSLQVGAAVTDTPPGILDLSNELIDFAETAAVISALDMIITVDTAVAHLAGSLGKPVWLMLAHLADWRWLIDRNDSPWYPTTRIFRQRRPGDWEQVIERVMAELQS